MVGQVVAGAVAPVVVNSATDETGLINQLFKIGILIGGLILIGIAVAIVVFVFSIDFGGIFDTITSPFRTVFNVFDAGFSVASGIFGGAFSGGKNKRPGLTKSALRYLNR